MLEAIKKFTNSKSFAEYAENIATNMVKQVYAENYKTWRHAAFKGMRSSQIRKALKSTNSVVEDVIESQIESNAKLIKSIPENIAVKVNEKILKEAYNGTRGTDIENYIKKLVPSISNYKAKLIARTETSKTSVAITKARAQRLNLNWYVWETSKDERTRSSHKHMQGVLCEFSNPIVPEKLIGLKTTLKPGIAAEFPNCRCYPSVLTDIDDVSWPHKVLKGNTIVTMTRNEFLKYSKMAA